MPGWSMPIKQKRANWGTVPGTVPGSETRLARDSRSHETRARRARAGSGSSGSGRLGRLGLDGRLGRLGLDGRLGLVVQLPRPRASGASGSTAGASRGLASAAGLRPVCGRCGRSAAGLRPVRPVCGRCGRSAAGLSEIGREPKYMFLLCFIVDCGRCGRSSRPFRCGVPFVALCPPSLSLFFPREEKIGRTGRTAPRMPCFAVLYRAACLKNPIGRNGPHRPQSKTPPPLAPLPPRGRFGRGTQPVAPWRRLSSSLCLYRHEKGRSGA